MIDSAIVEKSLEGPPDHAGHALAETVYGHLRAIAQRQMNDERREHTLTATALVHEAFMRMRGHPAADGAERGADPERRLAFVRASAEAMRRILIEHARARGRAKRGGDLRVRARVDLDQVTEVADLASEAQSEVMVAFDEAFGRLECHGARFAEVVRLRFFAGLSVAETAATLGVSERTVNNDWNYARAWLAREIRAVETP